MSKWNLLYRAFVVAAVAQEASAISTCCNSLLGIFEDAGAIVVQTTASLLLNATGVAQNSSTASTAQSVPYLSLIENRWSNTAVLNPGCVVRPKSAQEVSQAVKSLVANQCQFAIKSGGHMPIPGANSIDGGVSIDLGLLNSTVLSPDRSYVSLGAGGTWGHAYDNMESEKVGFPGGVCGTTGVGGVSLGGGESLFQPRVGWVVDNVLNYEIVLASGEIVNANQTSNEDLYQALKGGSSNFGVVTRVDIAAFELGDIWGGQIILPAVPAVVDTALQATTNFTEQNNEHLNAGLQMAFSNFHNGYKVIDFGFVSTDGEVNPYILKNITAIQPQLQNTVTTRSLSNVIQEFDEVLPAGYRQIGATITFVNDLDTIRGLHDVFEEVYETIKDVPNMDWIIFYNPQPRVIEKYSAARGGNMLGLQNSTSNDQIVALLIPRWQDAQYDARMYAAAKAWVAGAQAVTQRLGTAHPFLYLNFAMADQNPFCTYGAESVDFLRTTAKKYDPTGVFQRLVPGGFKISKTTC